MQFVGRNPSLFEQDLSDPVLADGDLVEGLLQLVLVYDRFFQEYLSQVLLGGPEADEGRVAAQKIQALLHQRVGLVHDVENAGQPVARDRVIHPGKGVFPQIAFADRIRHGDTFRGPENQGDVNST